VAAGHGRSEYGAGQRVNLIRERLYVPLREECKRGSFSEAGSVYVAMGYLVLTD
jgi:hypothetical protein